MITRISFSTKTGKSQVMLCFMFLILIFPVHGFGQPTDRFFVDSIPTRDGKVEFSVRFESDLTKEEFHKRAFRYLNAEMDPYSGLFLADNNDSTVCEIVDYLDIESNFAYVFAMYMTYNLKLDYYMGACELVISDIRYMEKGYFETQEETERKLNMPEYSAKEIMIDKGYSTLTVRNASEKTTEASLKRINHVVKNLEIAFSL